MSYINFILANARFLSFGALLTFFGNFGQTYYIALFNAPIRADYGLTHGDFGLIYSVATMSSALCLVWIGRKIDDIDLRKFVVLACLGYAGACLVFSSDFGSVIFLGLGLFLLRMTGQGLMGHTAMTSMARYFDRERGRAMSVAALGHPFGEAVLPSLAVVFLAVFGWRSTWQYTGYVMIVVLIPLALWFLQGHGERHRRYADSTSSQSQKKKQERKQWTRPEVIRDYAFYFILPCAVASPLILTGLFFHQVHLAETKGWSLAWIATCFVGYAGATVIGSLITGVMVDRFGAVRLLAWYLLPLLMGIVTLTLFHHPGAALVYMVAAGLTTGASSITLTSTWAEIYGTAHIGAIRALVSAFMVFSTSLAPVGMGMMIDRGTSMETITLICSIYIVVCIILLMCVRKPLLRRSNAELITAQS